MLASAHQPAYASAQTKPRMKGFGSFEAREVSQRIRPWAGQGGFMDPSFHRASFLRSLFLLLICAAIGAEASWAGCSAGCVASAWQKSTQGVYMIGGSPSAPEPFRLVGFGAALADHPISCSGGENPPFEVAEATWQDFRFYGSSASLGLFRGEVNRELRSFISIEALTTGGLFPADFTNNLFLQVTPLAFPSLEYQNSQVMSTYAASVHQAPPELSVVGLQVSAEDILEAVSSVPLGAPEAIILRGGQQTFLPSGCLTAEWLPSSGDVLRIRIGYPGGQPVKVAYFLHSLGGGSAFHQLDGVTDIPPAGFSEVELSLSGVTANTAIFDAIVLEPFEVECAVRLPVDLAGGAS
jgi:hypothetical protein